MLIDLTNRNDAIKNTLIKPCTFVFVFASVRVRGESSFGAALVGEGIGTRREGRVNGLGHYMWWRHLHKDFSSFVDVKTCFKCKGQVITLLVHFPQ